MSLENGKPTHPYMATEKKKIIIVDDDTTNLAVARKMLADKYTVGTVTSGKKLFEMLEKVTPDLILLDVEMPEMSGYEVIKALKDSEKHASIPVIFLTALIDSESEIKGLDLGAVDYVYKPFSQKLLIKRIKMHLL
jgi:putative two-component system response regulator